jgi:hypothetical protein
MRSTLILAALILFLSACKPKLDAPQPSAGEADFSKFIVVGGSYLSGYQDGALWRKGQQNSIGALMNRQFMLAGGGVFNQPLMPNEKGLGLNLKPWEGVFIHKSRLGDKTDCEGVTAMKPIKDTVTVPGPYLTGIAGNSFQNLAVPFGRTQDFFNPFFSKSWQDGNPNPFYYRFASDAGTSRVYDDAVGQNPTFFVSWFGFEDIYEHVKYGADKNPIPSLGVFDHYLIKFLDGLTASGAKGLMATIPDFSTIPFFTTIPWNGLELSQSKADSLNQLTGFLFNFVEGKNGFVIADPSAPSGFRKMVDGEFICLTLPLDSVKCDFMGVFTPLPDRYVLDMSEVQSLRQVISAYNSHIKFRAEQYGLAVADMHAYFQKIKDGILWNGVAVNSTFVSGGFFSLDGFHPHQKGYLLIANEFLKAINEKYAARIPPVNCPDCDGVIFP